MAWEEEEARCQGDDGVGVGEEGGAEGGVEDAAGGEVGCWVRGGEEGYGSGELLVVSGCVGRGRGGGAGAVEDVEGYHEVASVEVGGAAREGEGDGYVVGLVVFYVGEGGDAVGIGAVVVLEVDGEGGHLVGQVGVVEEDVGDGGESVEEGRGGAEEDGVEEGALGRLGGCDAVGLVEDVLVCVSLGMERCRDESHPIAYHVCGFVFWARTASSRGTVAVYSG